MDAVRYLSVAELQSLRREIINEATKQTKEDEIRYMAVPLGVGLGLVNQALVIAGIEESRPAELDSPDVEPPAGEPAV